MADNNLTWIANFICGIADDVLRDVYALGKYRDVILPMTVIPRLHALLEPTKAVLRMKEPLVRPAGNRAGCLAGIAGSMWWRWRRRPGIY
jgi:type I restriction enzyme M protein